MTDELETPPKGGAREVMDELFVQSRMRLDMIIEILCGKLEKMAEQVELNPAGMQLMKEITDHLERLVFLRQMNMAKVRDLANLAPKQYRNILTDEGIRQRLRATRDVDNFPKRGPRGPREDIAPPPEPSEDSPS